MPTPPPSDDLTQSWIADRFELAETIGEGGLSKVYSAWDHRLQRQVALKVMNTAENRRQQSEQTWREAMPASYLSHPNIVRIYDYGFVGERAYIVMEMVEGETLEDCLHRGPLHLTDFYRLARQGLEGMAAAHDHGFVHRDLKPGNFMLQRADGEPFRVKILDFGLSKFIKVPRPQSTDHYNTLLGSIHYMAPEQFERRPVDHRTDLYSMGCIFYEALTSHNAFDADSVGGLIDAHLRAWPQQLDRLRPGLPQGLEEWVFGFLEKRLERRWEDARTALDEMPPLRQSHVETQRLGF